MARYSKIDRRIWNDEKFRRLSRPQPCGQFLFLYLLTNPFVGPIPGVYSAGEAMLAEALAWDIDGFRKGFREAVAEGLVNADFEARLIWLPNAIRYNEPASPNVVTSWRDPWDELPECQLKHEAWEALRTSLENKGLEWSSAFREACPQPSPNRMAKRMSKTSAKPSGKPSPNQEQKQEQENTLSLNGPSDDPVSQPNLDLTNAVREVFAHYLHQTDRNATQYELTPFRLKKGLARLNECLRKTKGNLQDAIELMKKAVDALVKSDFHMGRDPKTNGKRYCDWVDNLFKTYEQMEARWNQ